jgi:hypothetical protein
VLRADLTGSGKWPTRLQVLPDILAATVKHGRYIGNRELRGREQDMGNFAGNRRGGGDKGKSTTRRNVLQMGAGLAAAGGLSRGLAAPAVARDPIAMPNGPNIIVLMTDQERHHRHWPDGWAERHLPSLQRQCGASPNRA